MLSTSQKPVDGASFLVIHAHELECPKIVTQAWKYNTSFYISFWKQKRSITTCSKKGHSVSIKCIETMGRIIKGLTPGLCCVKKSLYQMLYVCY